MQGVLSDPTTESDLFRLPSRPVAPAGRPVHHGLDSASFNTYSMGSANETVFVGPCVPRRRALRRLAESLRTLIRVGITQSLANDLIFRLIRTWAATFHQGVRRKVSRSAVSMAKHSVALPANAGLLRAEILPCAPVGWTHNDAIRAIAANADTVAGADLNMTGPWASTRTPQEVTGIAQE